jgi:hypothetical protein
MWIDYPSATVLSMCSWYRLVLHLGRVAVVEGLLAVVIGAIGFAYRLRSLGMTGLVTVEQLEALQIILV